ncbi:unnamed protein product [Meloidogyne enterolobii]|uniref:Uncharacterized protein n=2 Tax=Meloidogyne enterolobii TaxID=390850 RepID=A0ACB1AX36_MELEN
MGRKILELRPSDLLLFSQQIGNGLQQLLRANAANVHSAEHWAMFFSILEAVGAAAYQDDDFDLVDIIHPVSSSPPAPLTSQQPLQQPPPSEKSSSYASGSSLYKRGTLVLAPNLSRHDSAAFLKVVETLGFLGRDAAHITPENFGLFIHCLRMMVEASMDGGKYTTPIQSLTITSPTSPNKQTGNSSSNTSKQFHVPHENSQKQRKTNEDASGGLTESEEKMSDQEKLANCYVDASLQLLNICAQLQARAANIYKDWSETNESVKIDETATKTTELWSKYWRPLMQAIARMACDCRRLIRKQALEALGTAFRVPALGELMIPADWEDCFAEVLFPLLSRLLTGPPISPMDPIGMEEARIRAIQLACKVLLGNLTKITSLKSFPDLFLRLFDLMDQFLEENACSDLLAEVIQESLKNCLLVCENFGVFQDPIEGLKAEISGRLEALTVKHSNSASSKGV